MIGSDARVLVQLLRGQPQRGPLAERLPAPAIPIWLKLCVGALLIVTVTIVFVAVLAATAQRPLHRVI